MQTLNVLANAPVNVHAAKTNFSQLLERAHAGEEIILSKAGKPYARLLPLSAPSGRTPGKLNGKINGDFFDPLPESELSAWS